MKAGRELDMQIAEDVMGWTVIDSARSQGFPPLEAVDLMEGEERPAASALQTVPPYSTDIREALVVEAKMQEFGSEIYGRFLEACISFCGQKRIYGSDTQETWLSADPADVCQSALMALKSKCF